MEEKKGYSPEQIKDFAKSLENWSETREFIAKLANTLTDWAANAENARKNDKLNLSQQITDKINESIGQLTSSANSNIQVVKRSAQEEYRKQTALCDSLANATTDAVREAVKPFQFVRKAVFWAWLVLGIIGTIGGSLWISNSRIWARAEREICAAGYERQIRELKEEKEDIIAKYENYINRQSKLNYKLALYWKDKKKNPIPTKKEKEEISEFWSRAN